MCSSDPHMALLGLDVGTTELKVALYEPSGRRLAFASFEYPVERTQPDHAELSPEALWAAVCNAIRAVTAQAPDSPPVALAISSQGESFVALDGRGTPLGPFILNIDSRAGPEMDEFVARTGKRRLFELTGLPPHPMYTLPKVAWLRKHRPEMFARAHRFRFVQDFILERLGAEPGIDRSLASRTLGMNLHTGDWEEDLLAQAGLSREQLSPVVASDAARGTVEPKLAAKLGLRPDTLCVAGGHDQACCAAGAGDVTPGSAVDGTGTFECLSLLLEHPQLDPVVLEANLPSERHVLPGLFLTLAYLPGGAVLKWFRDQFARDVVEQARERGTNSYELMLANAPGEPTGLFVFPHVLGTGTPWLDTAARAALVGFSQETTRDEVLKAVIEGVSYEMRLNLEVLNGVGIRVRRMYATGGGARSRVWLQVKADVFGCEVVPVEEESGCLGAALCAGVGSSVFRSWPEAVAATRRYGPAIAPHAGRNERYNELFQQYRELEQRMYGYQTPVAGIPVSQESAKGR